MFLHPGAKLAQKVDINGALYQSVSSTHGEKTATSVIQACRQIQQLRSSLHEPPTTEQTNTALKQYHQTIAHLLDSSKLQPSLSVPLLWVNAFDAEDHAAISDLRFDRLCTLFNLAVNEASLAATAFQRRRADTTAIRTATKHFQLAAGYFHAAGLQPTPTGVRHLTTDLLPQTLRALEYAMLGNAQQAFHHLCTENGTSDSLLARFATGVRDFYEIAATTCRDADVIDTRVNALVGRPCGTLAAYFEACAQSNAAAAAKETHDVSQEIARLHKATTAVIAAKQLTSKLDGSTLASVRALRTDLEAGLQALEQDVTSRLENAEEENRRYYFSTASAACPVIGCHKSVKAVDVTEALKACVVASVIRPFDELPDADEAEASGMAMRYADLAAGVVADEVGRLNAAVSTMQHVTGECTSAIAKVRSLQESQVKLSQEDEAKERGEERVALEVITKAQQNGGSHRLRALQLDVLNQAEAIRQDIEKIEDALQKEDNQDRQLRSRSANRRTSSHELTYQYRSKLTKLRTNLEQAANADTMVSSELGKHVTAIDAMINADVMSSTFQSNLHNVGNIAAATGVSSADNMEALIACLDSRIQESEELITRKNGLLQELEKKKQLDNAMTATTGITDDSEEMEQMCSIVEAKYKDIKEEVQGVCKQMNKISDEVTQRREELLQCYGNDDMHAHGRHEHMARVYKHQAAAMKFHETLRHLEQGLDFYRKEQDNVTMLKRTVDDYVMARDAEFNDLMMAHAAPPNRAMNVPNPYQSSDLYHHNHAPPSSSSSSSPRPPPQSPASSSHASSYGAPAHQPPAHQLPAHQPPPHQPPAYHPSSPYYPHNHHYN